MTTNLTNKGITVIKDAKSLDQKGNEAKTPEEQEPLLRQAVQKYAQGIEYLCQGKKFEKCEQLKTTLTGKILEYMDRAEKLKGILEQLEANKNKKKPATAGNTGGDEENKEQDKMESALSEAIVMETPNVKWSDVAGLQVAKDLLQEAVILPVRFPHFFTGGRKSWKGILLYGPPGTGKSYLAKAVATEANNSTFFSVSSSSLVSKYVGESEKQVKTLFKIARQKKPSIVFIDEIDSMASARSDGENESSRRLKTEFLVQMDGVGSDAEGILVLGATNCPWDLDSAIRRRFQKRIYIPLPGQEARMAMFKIHVGKTPCKLSDQDLQRLGEQTDGMSGSDIANVVKDALMEPIRVMKAATFFMKQQRPGSMDPNDYRIIPCRPPSQTMPKQACTEQLINSLPLNAPFETTLMVIPEAFNDKVEPLELRRDDFMRVLSNARGSVSQSDLDRHDEWTKEFGMEG